MCCGYAPPSGFNYPVYWNQYNGVVQCHNCGQIYVPEKLSWRVRFHNWRIRRFGNHI